MPNFPVPMIALVLVAAGAGAYFLANAAADPLEDVHSGVVANVNVHAAVVDGSTGSPAAAASIAYGPTGATAASLVTGFDGLTIKPLDFNWGQPTPNQAGCTPITVAFDQTLTNNNAAWVFGTVLKQNGQGAESSVTLYKNGQYAGMTPSSQFGGTWSIKTDHPPGTVLRAHAAAVGLCSAYSSVWTIPGATTQVCPPSCGGAPVQQSANCVAVNTASFRAWLTQQGQNPDCVSPNSYNLLYGQWQIDTQNAAPSAGSAPTALITATLSGDVSTKNMATPITINAEAVIQTAAGKTITRTLPTVTVPAAGGPITGLAASWDILKTDLGTGKSTVTVNVRAQGQDALGQVRSASGAVPVEITTDFAGNIKLNLRATPMSLVVGMPDGTTTTKTVILKPASIA